MNEAMKKFAIENGGVFASTERPENKPEIKITVEVDGHADTYEVDTFLFVGIEKSETSKKRMICNLGGIAQIPYMKSIANGVYELQNRYPELSVGMTISAMEHLDKIFGKSEQK